LVTANSFFSTSRCGTQFCIACGKKWLTCECPFFETDEVGDDTDLIGVGSDDAMYGGLDMVAAAPRTSLRPHVPLAPAVPPPAGAVGPPARIGGASDALARRMQSRHDDGGGGGLTRRLASMDIGDEYQVEDEYMVGGAVAQYHDDGEDNMLGLAGPAGRYAAEDYRRRPQSYVVPTPPSPPPAVSPQYQGTPARSPFGHPSPTHGLHHGGGGGGHHHQHHLQQAPTPPTASPFAPQNAGHAPPPPAAPSPFAPKSPGHGMHLPHMAPPPPAPHPHHAVAQPPPLGAQTPPATAFDRSGGDYIAGVSRARGMRDSMERRLADRFSENRQSPAHAAPGGAGAPSVMSMPAAPMAAPMAPPQPPAQQQHHSHHHQMAPPPLVSMMSAPPAPAGATGMPGHGLRRHSLEDDMYSPFGGGGASRRPAGGMGAAAHPRGHDGMMGMMVDPAASADFGAAGMPGATSSSMRRRFENNRAYSMYDEAPRTSSMAGLNSGRGANRVFEWRSHVEPGVPDGEEVRGPR
jgi:hypothetical protein